jgi:nucleoid-associated protein YgaU
MQACRPNLGRSRRSRRVLLFVPVCMFFCSGLLRAQDVAQAARQERARKGQQQQNPPHVYTDEDLKKDKILTQEDRAKVEARKKLDESKPAPQNAENAPATTPADAKQQPAESLGEIARRYRNEKATREAEEAAKKSITPFPYLVPTPSFAALASPVGPVGPNVADAPLRTATKIAATRNTHAPNRGSSAAVRISPFQPRPLLAAPSPRHIAPVNPPPLAPVEQRGKPHLDPSREAHQMHAVQVQRGDSWWSLAGHYLGSGARWPELRNLNGAADQLPKLLREGAVIRVPASVTQGPTTPGSRVTVRPGDSLWSLARAHLGHGSAWGCLASANPEVTNYTKLPVGSVLALPSADMLESCTGAMTVSLQR